VSATAVDIDFPRCSGDPDDMELDSEAGDVTKTHESRKAKEAAVKQGPGS
jgi:hypothetical protein